MQKRMRIIRRRAVRKRLGRESTDCRVGTRGIATSMQCAAATIRLVRHDGNTRPAAAGLDGTPCRAEWHDHGYGNASFAERIELLSP